jgi:hypothetical protein
MVVRKKCQECSKLTLMADFENSDQYPDNKKRECKNCEELLTTKNEEMSKEVVVKEKVVVKKVVAKKVVAKKIETMDDLIDTLESEAPIDAPKEKEKPKRKSRAKVKVEEVTEEVAEVKEIVEAAAETEEVETKEVVEEAEVVEAVEAETEAVDADPKKKSSRGSKQVEQITVVNNVPTDEIIATWDSVRAAGEGIDKSSAGIRNVCRGVNKSAHGFFWRYKTEVE